MSSVISISMIYNLFKNFTLVFLPNKALNATPELSTCQRHYIRYHSECLIKYTKISIIIL